LKELFFGIMIFYAENELIDSRFQLVIIVNFNL